MTAKYIHAPGEAQIAAPSANIPAGRILNDTALGACIKEGLNATNASGEPIHVRYVGVVEIPSASGTTFAKNAVVQYANSTGLAVVTGDFHVGRALEAKTSGQLSVRVILNKPA